MEVGRWRLEGWKLEVIGGWVGGWGMEAGAWSLEVRGWRLEVGRLKVGDWRLEAICMGKHMLYMRVYACLCVHIRV